MKAATTADAPLRTVESHLRANGYAVLTGRKPRRWRRPPSRTEADVVAVRGPSSTGPEGVAHCEMDLENSAAVGLDPALGVANDRWDVIVGEVRNGLSDFNPALRDRHRLHAVLSSAGDVFGAPLKDVVDGLLATGRIVTPTAQVRLVAFETVAALAGREVRLHEIFWMGDPQLSAALLSARGRRPRRPIGYTAGIRRWAWTATATAVSRE